MELIQKLKNRYHGYKEKRFLETHGCKTWREYERRYDSDVGYLARCSQAFYYGYPHVFALDPDGYRDLTAFGIHPYFESIEKMTKWCEENCTGKWRNDWHRGFWNHHDHFEFNGIGGTDIMFFAFKEERDYIWFTLTWQ